MADEIRKDRAAQTSTPRAVKPKGARIPMRAYHQAEPTFWKASIGDILEHVLDFEAHDLDEAWCYLNKQGEPGGWFTQIRSLCVGDVVIASDVAWVVEPMGWAAVQVRYLDAARTRLEIVSIEREGQAEGTRA